MLNELCTVELHLNSMFQKSAGCRRAGVNPVAISIHVARPGWKKQNKTKKTRGRSHTVTIYDTWFSLQWPCMSRMSSMSRTHDQPLTIFRRSTLQLFSAWMIRSLDLGFGPLHQEKNLQYITIANCNRIICLLLMFVGRILCSTLEQPWITNWTCTAYLQWANRKERKQSHLN